MVHHLFYRESDKEEPTNKVPEWSACYLYFCRNHEKGTHKRYIHTYFNPYPEFTIEEIDKVLKTFKVKYKIYLKKLSRSAEFTRGMYPVVVIDTKGHSLAQIKLFYFVLRYFFESDGQVRIMRLAIEMKKLKPSIHILNYILYAVKSAGFIGGHSLSWGTSGYDQDTFKSYTYSTLFKELSDKGSFNIEYGILVYKKNLTAEELIKLYEKNRNS